MRINSQKSENVRRIAAELAGKKPAPRQPVTTTCGEKLCVNPAHMLPVSRKELGMIAAKNGSFSTPVVGWKRSAAQRSNRKLSDEQIEHIRSSDESGPELAKKFGVDKSYINRIRRGKSLRQYAHPFAWLLNNL